MRVLRSTGWMGLLVIAACSPVNSNDVDGGKSGDAGPARCGDHVRTPPEACDGHDVGAQTCANVGLGFVAGTLACSPGCSLETGACTLPTSFGRFTLASQHLLTPRAEAVGFVLADKLYVLGGRVLGAGEDGDGGTASAEVFTITASGDLSAPLVVAGHEAGGTGLNVVRRGAAVARVTRPNGSDWIYVVGGFNASGADGGRKNVLATLERAAVVHDSQGHETGELGPFVMVTDPVAPQRNLEMISGRSFAAAVARADSLYVIGGADAASPPASVDHLPLPSAAFASPGPTPAGQVPRTSHAIAVGDDFVALMGGHFADPPEPGAVDGVLVAPFSAGGVLGPITKTTALRQAREGASAVFFNQRAFVLGGAQGAGATVQPNEVAPVNPQVGGPFGFAPMEAEHNLDKNRSLFQAFHVARVNRIYVVGGYDQPGFPGGALLDSILVAPVVP